MSRSLALLVALAALTSLALPAHAQTAGGSLTITGLAGSVTSNQTTAVVPFTVQLSLNQGTCVGGSNAIRVDLTATRAGSNATVEVQPASLTFRVGQADTLGSSYAGTGGASLVVKPGLVRDNVTVPVTVKAATTVTCSVPGAGMAPGPLSAEGTSTLTFEPVSEEVRAGPTEALPGFEVPALLAAVALAVFLARRRSA